MIALLKKDLRLNLPTVIAGVIMMLSPYIITLLSYFYTPDPSVHDLRQRLFDSAVAGTFLSVFVAAVFGASAFSIERRERWADFLAMLPASRWKICMSKLTIDLTAIAAVLIFHIVLIVIFAGPVSYNRQALADDDVRVLGITLCATSMAFGVGWLAGTLLASPAFASGITIGSTGGLIAFVGLAARGYRDFESICTVACLGAGISAFILGTAIYLLRVEP